MSALLSTLATIIAISAHLVSQELQFQRTGVAVLHDVNNIIRTVYYYISPLAFF